MKDFLHRLFVEGPARANLAHASLLALIGGYFIYMGVMMIQNTQKGDSSMPMSQSIALCAVMCVIGLLVIGYGVLVFYHVRKRSKDNKPDSEE